MPEANPHPEHTGKRARKHSRAGLLPWGLGIAALTAVGAFFGLEAWLNRYLASEAFRGKTEAALGRALRAEARLEPIQRQGFTLASDALELKGAPASAFDTARVQGIRADVDLAGLWQRLWKIDHVSFQTLNLDLTKPLTEGHSSSSDPGSPAALADAISADAHPDPRAGGGGLAGLLPNRAQIALMQTDRASVQFAGAGLHSCRMVVRPGDAGAGWDAALENGELNVPGLPALDLREARFALRNGGGVLRTSRLLAKKGGQASVSGEWGAEGTCDFHAKLENISAEPFLPQWWQTRLSGMIQGALRFQRGTGAPETLSGDLRLTGGKLEAFPLLSQLDAFVGAPRFRQVALKNASAKLHRSSGRTELTEIDLDADGTLRVQGRLSVQNGTLQGQMQLGIPPSVIQWLPSARTKMFGESRDGYVWTPFTLSGPFDQPVEDLTPRLAAAAVEAVTETLKKIPASVPQAVPEAVPEAAKGLLDAVKSLLPGR